MIPIHERRYLIDQFIQILGYEGLNDLGFINIPDAGVEPNFAQTGAKTAPHIAGLGVCTGGQGALHAVIARDRWRHINDVQWDAIQDSLQLVTRVLDDPSILPFFAALLATDSHKEIQRSKTKYVRHKRQYIRQQPLSFQLDHDWDTEKQKEVWKLLRLSSLSMTWQFGHADDSDIMHHDELGFGAWGYTTPNASLPCIPGKTIVNPAMRIGNSVLLNPDYLAILTGEISPSDLSFALPDHDIDGESALLRTKLHLAMNILHEFTHAFWGATSTMWTPPDPHNDYLPQWPNGYASQRNEPYFRDQRTNELGYCFIVHVFSNILEPLGPSTPAAPYGMLSHRWPDMFDTNNSSIPLMSAKKWGTLWSVSCAVDMAWIQSIFTQKFWNHDVEKLGMLKALDVPRELGFRRVLHRYFPGESPTILATREVFDAGIGRYEIPCNPDIQFVAHGKFAGLRVELHTETVGPSDTKVHKFSITETAAPSHTVARKPVGSGAMNRSDPMRPSGPRPPPSPRLPSGRKMPSSPKAPVSPKKLRLSSSWAEKPISSRIEKPPSSISKTTSNRKRDRLSEAFKKLFH